MVTPTSNAVDGIETSIADAPKAPSALWELLEPIRWRLAFACVIEAVSAAASVVPFIAVAALAKVLLQTGPVVESQAWYWGLVAVGALVVRVVCSFAAGAITHYADNDFQLHVRRRLAERLTRAPLGWFTVRSAGSIKKGVADDVTAMHHVVAHAALELTAAVVVPIVTLAYLFSVNWLMSLFVMVPLVLGLGLYGRQMAALSAHMPDYNRGMERVNNAAVEFIQGISVVKAFGQTGRAHKRFIDAANGFLKLLWDMTRGSLRSTSLAEVVLSPVTSLAVVMTAGALFAHWGWLARIDVIPFALLGLGLTGPIFGMWFASMTLVQARTASIRVRELLNTEVLDETQSPRLPKDSRLELQDVAFSYDGEHDALTKIDLSLEPGTTTALVGRSGSGKTTVAKLIPRFWDPTRGKITLGGVDLRHIAPRELYRHISFVFQDVQLLHTTVIDNIRLARPSASAVEVEAAARSAQIHERILELPRGYDSVIGEDARLSGGEAQRVSIARALLADAPILVLDEATAFADPESEAKIQDALSALTAGRTLLVIAHRLSTIQHADQIVVLDRGSVAERGDHLTLVASGGLYSKLWSDHERAVRWQPKREHSGSVNQ